jgi:hypothetical protein
VEKIQPQGVFLVGVLTILSALVILVFAVIALGLGSGGNRLPEITAAGLIGGFGVLFLMDAVLIFRGMRTGYYLSMTLWIVLLSVVCYGYYSLFSVGLYFELNLYTLLLYVYPLLYPVFCLVYFLRKSVRGYFGT